MATPAEQLSDDFQQPQTAIPLGPPVDNNGQEISEDERVAREQASPQEEYVQDVSPAARPAYSPQRPPSNLKFNVSGPISSLSEIPGMMGVQRVVRQPYRQIKEPESNKSAREFLDELMVQPESTDWRLKISRYGPPQYDDKPVPRGICHTSEVMPFDNLREEIIATWGGGDYRVTIVDESGQHVPGKPSLNMRIPVQIYPPKFKQYQKVGDEVVLEEPAFPAEKTDYQVEMRRMDEESKMAMAEERKRNAEIRRQQSQITQMIKERELSKMQRDLLRDGREDENSQVKMLEKQIDMMAKSQDDANKRFELLITKMSEAPKVNPDAGVAAMVKEVVAMQQQNMQNFMSVVTSMIPKKGEDDGKGVRELMVGMQQANAQMMTGLATALAGRGDNGKELREVMLAGQNQVTQLMGNVVTAMAPRQGGEVSESQKMVFESNRNLMEMVHKTSSKENSQQSQLLSLLVEKVLTPKQDPNAVTTETILRLIGEGRKQMREGLQFAQMINPPQEEAPAVPDADGYDPKAGMMGNLGKVIYLGLKHVMQAASQRPELLETLMKMVGKRHPNEEELVNAANRMAAEQEARRMPAPPPQVYIPYHQPPQMMAPQYVRPGQSALITPMAPAQPPMQRAPEMRIVPTPGAAPAVQPPPATVSPQTPPAVAQVVVPAVTAQVQQKEAASELASEMSGIDSDNGDMTAQAEQILAEQSETTPTEEGEEVEETPEERLKYYVTESMKEATTNIRDRQNRHTWPLDAYEYWSGHFLDQLASLQDIDQRIALIGSMCDGAVWEPLAQLMGTVDGGAQIASFRDAVNTLIEMHRTKLAQAQGQAAPVQLPPQPKG